MQLKLDRFFAEVEQFCEFGERTLTEHKEICGQSVAFYVNEFWTSKQRVAHPLHEVSYRACFKPQLPRFFVERLTVEGDVVYDPFMGRGTTLLESALMGRRVAGNDINPLSKILCLPRLSPPSLEEVGVRLDEISLEATVESRRGEDEELLAFYHEDTLSEISALRGYFVGREEAGELDGVDRWIRMVATNRLTGHSPGFFSVYTMPPNQAVTAERQRMINEKRGQVPVAKDVRAIIYKKSKQLLSRVTVFDEKLLEGAEPLLTTSQAESTDEIPSGSVKLVVTSPPFLDVVDYRTDNWLRCWFNGIDSSELPISQLKSEELWVGKMTEVFRELGRLLEDDGVVAFEVGEVKKGKLMLEELVIRAALGAGLTVHGVMINAQEFTKTANCWGVDNKSKGTNTNRIVILSK
ncbi:MAG: DNA methyltransferase [Akkermansiaceae bacterium]